MLTALWTATLRAVVVLTAALAVGVIVVSLQAARAQAGPAADGVTVPPTPSSDVPDEAQPLQPVLATTQTAPSPTATASQAAPALRYAAPSEALPSIRARAISGQAHLSGSLAPSLPASRRLAAVLDVGASASPVAAQVALLAKEGLETRGYDVSLLEDVDSSDAPLRPDAYVSIRAAFGEDAGTGAEAWFCQVEGSLSGQLADLLIRGLAASDLPDAGQGDGEIADAEAFNCGLLLAGRARMPTVLLEVPASLAGEHDVRVLSQGLADGVNQFFQKYRASLLREDARQRLVWPASGPLTSQFGPSHPLGIDIAQSEGPIVAATDGVVLFAGGDPCCSYGLHTVVQGADGIITLYAHLESIDVAEGQRVRQGQPLGIVGCTGNCFGTHLHFEVIENGVRRDPLSYLP